MGGVKRHYINRINDGPHLLQNCIAYSGETEFGPETEKMDEPEYGHQESGLFVKLDSTAKSIKN